MPFFHSLSLATAGLLVLFSWIGIGIAFANLLNLPRALKRHLPLLACFGMATLTIAGGLMMLLRITSSALLGYITLAAAIYFLLSILRKRWGPNTATPRLPARRYLWLLPIGLVALTVYLTAVSNTTINQDDDKLAYVVFPKQILQTGTLLAPFDVRRLGTYGGHQFLQAQWIGTVQTLFGPEAAALCTTHAHLIDQGLCILIAAALLYNVARSRHLGGQLAAALLVAAFLLAPLPRSNTHSQASGMVLFLALAPMLPLLRRLRPAVILITAILAAAVATFRMNFTAAAFLTILLSCIWSRHRAAPFPILVKRAVPPLALAALALFPFAVLLLQSSGTPFYPLIHGYQQGRQSFLDMPLSFQAHIHWTLSSLLYPKILILLFPLVIAVRLRRWNDMVPVYIAAIFMAAATAWSFTNQGTANLYRLCSPPLFACAFGTLAITCRRWSAHTRSDRIAIMILLLAIPWVCAHEYSDLFRTTYPKLLLLSLLLAPAIGTQRRKLEAFAVLLLLAILVWGALGTRGTILDNSGSFFLLTAPVATVWIAMAAHALWLRYVARGVAAILLCLTAFSLANAYGYTLSASLALLVIGTAVLIWMVARSARSHLAYTRSVIAKAAMASAIALLLYIAAANAPFLFDNFAPAFRIAAIAGLFWLAATAPTTLLRTSCIAAILLLLLPVLALPSSLKDYPWQFPIASLALAAAFVLAFMRAKASIILCTLLILTATIMLTLPATTTVYTALATSPPAADTVALEKTYEDAQMAIPPGVKFFVMVPEPVRLNFQRNTLLTADYQIQFVSLPPGVPVEGSPESLRAYFTHLAIRYLLLSPPDLLTPNAIQPRQLRENLAQLAQSSLLTFNSPKLIVIDLQTPRHLEPNPP